MQTFTGQRTGFIDSKPNILLRIVELEWVMVMRREKKVEKMRWLVCLCQAIFFCPLNILKVSVIVCVAIMAWLGELNSNDI